MSPEAQSEWQEVLNPRTIWFMVVLVASIRFIGFFLAKIIGSKRSIVVTGAIGGLISSTAVTTSLSEQSKKTSAFISPFLAGILFANAIMFIRVFLEAKIVYPDLGTKLAIPLFVMTFFAFALGIAALFIKSKKLVFKKEVVKSQPFSLSEGIKFGIFFLMVIVAAKILPVFFGNTGLYVTALVSGLADTDAITLSMANLAGKGEIEFNIAITVITIAVMTNTVVKVVISYIFGSKKLALYSTAAFSLVIAAGGIALFFV